jgi:hypothetical protein
VKELQEGGMIIDSCEGNTRGMITDSCEGTTGRRDDY